MTIIVWRLAEPLDRARSLLRRSRKPGNSIPPLLLEVMSEAMTSTSSGPSREISGNA
jgi:hypothetical protein